ncbi:MAG: carbamoyl phosphate synthase small subunit, partial [Clostridia bacterium]|nr:carbamoyl phosphate synthase small subunit [Clostridia bacterium]
LKQYCVYGAVAQVSTTKAVIHPTTERRFAVTLIDCGVRSSVIDALCERGCEVTVVPHDTSAEVILAAKPDGVVLSGGPGDPAENTALIAELGALLGQKPIFAYGLGHQLLAIAAGGETAKLPYGHRGANQPVKFSETGRVYISSQNHGYVVSAAADGAQIWFENVNDHTCEGLVYPALRAFSVQFAPETCAELLFDRFAAAL